MVSAGRRIPAWITHDAKAIEAAEAAVRDGIRANEAAYR